MSTKAKVFIVEHEYHADHKVFFVDHDYRQSNQQIISPGVLVSHEHQADIKVFIVDHEYRATIKITRKNFPK